MCQVLDPAEEHTEQRSPEAKQRTLEKKKSHARLWPVDFRHSYIFTSRVHLKSNFVFSQFYNCMTKHYSLILQIYVEQTKRCCYRCCCCLCCCLTSTDNHQNALAFPSQK